MIEEIGTQQIRGVKRKGRGYVGGGKKKKERKKK